jgi:hypothetical protein
MTLTDCIEEEQSPVCCLCDNITVPEAVRSEVPSELLNKPLGLRGNFKRQIKIFLTLGSFRLSKE